MLSQFLHKSLFVPSEVVAITLLYSEAKCIYCHHQFMLAFGWVTGCIFLQVFFFTTIRHCLFWESLWEYVWIALCAFFCVWLFIRRRQQQEQNQPTRVRFYDWNTSNFSYWEKRRRNQFLKKKPIGTSEDFFAMLIGTQKWDHIAREEENNIGSI